MKIAINAISATAGGAQSYLVNLIRALPALGPHEYLLYLPGRRPPELAELPPGFQAETCAWAESGYAARLLWEQWILPRWARRWGADVLLCAGNFCPLRSSVPVLLLSRNALYFTPRYLQDLLGRRHYGWAARHLLMTRLAVLSARAARITVTPTAAMGEMMRAALGPDRPAPRAIPFGFQPWPGQNGATPAAPAPPPPFRFLLLSHYNYFRDFETVFQALATLRAQQADLHITLSARLAPGLRPGGYDTTAAYHLLHQLGLAGAVTMLGAVAYDELPRVYRAAHAVICPSYAESFGQTLLEAMALGLPVVASDIPAHREVAGAAALFFAAGDAADLARCCRRLMDDPALRARLRQAGLERAPSFSWRRHFQQLLAAAAEVAGA
jgi:glycosyltransferase involved in cell wall biosynthesis